MAEYIDRDAVYTAFANACTDVLERASEIYYIAGFSYEHVIEILDNIPADDVAPVVRCKDCKYSTLPSKQTQLYGKPGTLTCHNRKSPCNNRNVASEDYCSYADRKDDNAT